MLSCLKISMFFPLSVPFDMFLFLGRYQCKRVSSHQGPRSPKREMFQTVDILQREVPCGSPCAFTACQLQAAVNSVSGRCQGRFRNRESLAAISNRQPYLHLNHLRDAHPESFLGFGLPVTLIYCQCLSFKSRDTEGWRSHGR